ncbi:hypothetical protein [Paracoccus homiensis]|uniref:Uncharacterized protein n=1 Tax=Paracoccus homiensis TaxID=364199 RepID=A0A1I0J116_9RHOB|nr:hypothetical protein [Paracoccus homiensis]SEU03345.1 hypothetical protein SAMN04489858_12066 [Paracoccus homiensis]
MALSFPYALDFLANCLIGPEVALKLSRNDEASGSGDGRVWSVELARPLWTATYSLDAKDGAHAREINAKINALDGSSKTFLWADPWYSGPAVSAPNYSGVTVASISANRGALAFSGLHEDFAFTAGDYISIAYGGGKQYLGQLAEGGDSGQLEIRPYLPMGISVGASVQIAKPRMKAIIPPNGWTPFSSTRYGWGQGASITVLQKP